MGEVRADAIRLDPIKYAWDHCNRGIPLPTVLARSALIDVSSARAGGELTAAKVLAEKVARATNAATHSGVIRRRMPRTHICARDTELPRAPLDDSDLDYSDWARHR